MLVPSLSRELRAPDSTVITPSHGARRHHWSAETIEQLALEQLLHLLQRISASPDQRAGPRWGSRGAAPDGRAVERRERITRPPDRRHRPPPRLSHRLAPRAAADYLSAGRSSHPDSSLGAPIATTTPPLVSRESGPACQEQWHAARREHPSQRSQVESHIWQDFLHSVKLSRLSSILGFQLYISRASGFPFCPSTFLSASLSTWFCTSSTLASSPVRSCRTVSPPL